MRADVGDGKACRPFPHDPFDRGQIDFRRDGEHPENNHPPRTDSCQAGIEGCPPIALSNSRLPGS